VRLLTRATSSIGLLALALVMGAVAHGYNMFSYPLYVTDEGIYVQQAWAVLRQGRLSPYTYFYDHAPAGWILIAAWMQILPFQFQTFGTSIGTGRALMLVIHVVSVALLFVVTLRLSSSRLAAFLATVFFSLSPLAIFYQRQVLLDNLMVFWMLVALYLATRGDRRVVTPMLAGVAFGLAVLTKENAIFFGPIVGYLVYDRTRGLFNRRFVLVYFVFSAASSISLYFLYAMLKNELLPSDLSFDLNSPPADHVSLLYTIWWQLSRNQGGIFNPDSLFWEYSLRRWLPKDTLILAAGGIATLVNLGLGLRDRQHQGGPLVASLLAAIYSFYLARGSMMLEFYVVPLLPFMAMNVAMVLARLHGRLPLRVGQGAVAALLGMLLFHPYWGYVLVVDEFGKVVPHDLYKLPLTSIQTLQLSWIRRNVPPDAKIVMDDDLWADLHDVRPFYKWAHSHWKAAADPDVRDKLFAKNWRNIDYLVMSNKMRIAMEQNNGDGSEDWILTALANADQVWAVERGDIRLEVHRVRK
jgi:4-amino-4-deoxy-L-arabinose transferase-like glycosyltransferase